MKYLSHFFEHKNTQTLNLFRLFVLRNILIGAAFLFIIFAAMNDYKLPYTDLISILVLLFSINAVTGWWIFQSKPINDNTLIWQLIIDVAAFTGILYFTGGASNPFGWFYLVPIFITATLLPGRAIWLITALSMFGYTSLMFFYEPMLTGSSAHNMQMQHNTGFHQHVIGMWLGYMLTALLVAYVISRMANSLRERDQHLAKARESALRDERLVALGTLAAGTAHELGTPLSTIAVLANEMREVTDSEELISDLNIIRQQVERCKLALSTLSKSAGEEMMQGGKPLPVHEYIASVISQWQQLRPNTQIDFKDNLSPINRQILAEKTLTQALINILNNASDASPKKIFVTLEQENEKTIIYIIDNGSGLNSMIQTHAGKQSYTNKEQGLGLGLFLAHASIERLGGEIFLSNQAEGGAIVKVVLPLTQPINITHD